MATDWCEGLTMHSVLMMSTWLRPKTSKTLFGPVIFLVFIQNKIKNKFKNLIRTSKFKFSFRGLCSTTFYWKPSFTLTYKYFASVHAIKNKYHQRTYITVLLTSMVNSLRIYWEHLRKQTK